MPRCFSICLWISLFGFPKETLLQGENKIGDAFLQWSNWSICFGLCSVKFQLRNCSKGCDDDQNMEIKECSTHENCSAYKVRLSRIDRFAPKLMLDVYVNNTRTSICHPVGIADSLCQIRGFESAEDNTNCDMIQTHSYGNTTCGTLQRIITNCNEPHGVTAVCKGTSK